MVSCCSLVVCCGFLPLSEFHSALLGAHSRRNASHTTATTTALWCHRCVCGFLSALARVLLPPTSPLHATRAAGGSASSSSGRGCSRRPCSSSCRPRCSSSSRSASRYSTSSCCARYAHHCDVTMTTHRKTTERLACATASCCARCARRRCNDAVTTHTHRGGKRSVSLRSVVVCCA